jgi:hypothetical protein
VSTPGTNCRRVSFQLIVSSRSAPWIGRRMRLRKMTKTEKLTMKRVLRLRNQRIHLIFPQQQVRAYRVHQGVRTRRSYPGTQRSQHLSRKRSFAFSAEGKTGRACPRQTAYQAWEWCPCSSNRSHQFTGSKKEEVQPLDRCRDGTLERRSASILCAYSNRQALSATVDRCFAIWAWQMG